MIWFELIKEEKAFSILEVTLLEIIRDTPIPVKESESMKFVIKNLHFLDLIL